MAPIPFGPRGRVLACAVLAAMLAMASGLALAEQIDIQGPAGSELFGNHVAVLPNGNFVVTDPYFSTSSVHRAGAVYLYDPSATLISVLTGGHDDDHVGEGAVVVLANGNFVVSSPDWHNADAASAGAVTWIDGTTGLSGVVSVENSLVGDSDSDEVGDYNGVVALTNGNYVVASPVWSNAGVENAGAVTWGDGKAGTVGVVSAANSLVGTEAQDFVGQDQGIAAAVVPLPNGNYVVSSALWHYATQANYGAVTWGDGEGGTVGAVSAQNSLLETTDCIDDTPRRSQITVLANSNYLVASGCWNKGSAAGAGAVTWVDGSGPVAATVSAGNSLVGESAGDHVGINGVTALTNGNSIVLSPAWNDGAGAVTWIDGSGADHAGQVSASNSLVGSIPGDNVGTSATALANGNYVVRSWWWSSPEAEQVGAVTWGNGETGLVGTVSAGNSLIGSTANDEVGFSGITALANGNYVVASQYWHNGALAEAGAVTWADGSVPTAGVVALGNSLVGSHTDDYVGSGGVTALADGNYVIASPGWSNGDVPNAGAATWSDGAAMLSGTPSASNSLVGMSENDLVGEAVRALANGNYVVASPYWHNGVLAEAGAATWADGTRGRSGGIFAGNSLVGSQSYDDIGWHVSALADGNYLVAGSSGPTGSLTLADGVLGTRGTPQPWNTLFADIEYGVYGLNVAYDVARARLVAGRPDENIVTLFSITDSIFASGFEP